METILLYALKSAIILAVFYIFYRLLLGKETFHRVNRVVLLGTAALSLLLPLCVITVRRVVELPSGPLMPSGPVGESVAMPFLGLQAASLDQTIAAVEAAEAAEAGASAVADSPW